MSADPTVDHALNVDQMINLFCRIFPQIYDIHNCYVFMKIYIYLYKLLFLLGLSTVLFILYRKFCATPNSSGTSLGVHPFSLAIK